MIRAFYSGVSGAVAQTRALDVVANNIANVNTTGYKSQQAQFSELVYTNMMTAQTDAPQNLKQGSGSYVMGVGLDLSQGSLQSTGRELDVALTGDGFFSVKNANGEINYTRQGNFQLSPQKDGNFALVTSTGESVLDSKMKPIIIDKDTEEINFATPKDGTADSIELGIVNFANPYALEKLGNSKYAATDNTGPAVVYENASILQGNLENSSVDLSEEMTDIILAQRGFQLNAKVIQTADEIEQTTNNLR